jgi:hypothetical protein
VQPWPPDARRAHGQGEVAGRIQGPWDYFTIGEIIPAEQAFRPAGQSACPLLKK